MRRAKVQRLLGLAGRVAILSNDEIEAMDDGAYCGWHEAAVLGLWSALPEATLDGPDFTSAGDPLRDLREKGRSVPSIDALIEALAQRHDVVLLTLDGHFEGIEGLRLDVPPG